MSPEAEEQLVEVRHGFPGPQLPLEEQAPVVGVAQSTGGAEPVAELFFRIGGGSG